MMEPQEGGKAVEKRKEEFKFHILPGDGGRDLSQTAQGYSSGLKLQVDWGAQMTPIFS